MDKIDLDTQLRDRVLQAVQAARGGMQQVAVYGYPLEVYMELAERLHGTRIDYGDGITACYRVMVGGSNYMDVDITYDTDRTARIVITDDYNSNFFG